MNAGADRSYSVLISAAKAMSGLPPKADMCSATRDVRFGPKADICGALSHVRFGPIADRNKATFYSITSLARSGNPGAMFNPITLAALRLITNSYLAGA